MIRNGKVKIVLGVVAVLLLIFQGLYIGVANANDYYLIHDWIFYGINYVIIIFLCSLYNNNQYIRWIQWMIGLMLLVANTTFFFYMGDVNVVVSKSKDNEQEVILKEYKKMNDETVRLKRRGFIFGKEVATLMGSSNYKTIEEETYKIDWVSGDTAIVTYQANDEGILQQNIFSLRSTNYISYQNVAVSLTGKWIEKDNPENYFMYDKGKIVYAKNGQLYYYNDDDTTQQGILSLVITGDEEKPSLAVVLNSDAEFGDNDLIMDGGTITISPITLKKMEGKVYDRE